MFKIPKMQIISYIFWTCLFVVFYSYAGYGVFLLLLIAVKRLAGAGKRKGTSTAEELPGVTLVVAAYNEENIIKEKIANCLSLNYPSDKLSILFVTDGSSDGTPDIIAQYPQIRLLHRDKRCGKTAALNRAMRHVHTPVTVFCDANTLLNRQAIQRIILHYRDKRTGGVAGEKRIFTRNNHSPAGMGEGLYWKYESSLKKLDAELYTVTGAAGELFSIRTPLWEDLPENVVLDDFVISTRINLKGYRIAYEPGAYALELPSASIREEKKRKVRISAGAFQAMVILKPVFNVLRHPVLFFQFVSHRFLRWTLTPLSLPLLLLTNILLVAYDKGYFLKITLVAQLMFYMLALAGAYVKSEAKAMKVAKICYYMFFMNYSVYLGFIRFLRGKQPGAWDKAQRERLAT